MENEKEFLTLEEVKKAGLEFYEYEAGVYMYLEEVRRTMNYDSRLGNSNACYLITEFEWILVEYDKLLVKGASFVRWYRKGVYFFEKDGKHLYVNNNQITKLSNVVVLNHFN